MATAMLADCELERDVFWEEACRYAVFIYNHIPPTGTGEDGKPRRSPAEVFYEMGPSLLLHYLRPFGAVCYAHIPPQLQGKKGHEDKAAQVRFMGFEDYTLTGYRLYDPATGQFFHSSATLKEGIDIMEMSIPRATVQRDGPLTLVSYCRCN